MNNDATDDVAQDEQTPEEIILGWHKGLQDNPGRRAELRRAKTLEEVFFAPAYHDLRLRLAHTRWRDPLRIALIAAVAVRVKDHVPATHGERAVGAAFQMAQRRKGSDTARVSDLRFRRLLATREPDKLFQTVPRFVALVDGRIDLADVATRLYFWNNPRTRRAWALEYYEYAPRPTATS